MKEAAVGPPGVMPIQHPMAALRNSTQPYRGRPKRVRKTSRHSTLEEIALTLNSSSTAISNSPMPNRPMTATTKLMPLTSSSMPMVSRTLPETVSIPTAASAKPIASDTSVLIGGEPPMPTKLANARKYTAKYSGGPKASATFATQEADTVMRMTPASAPNAAEPKAVVKAVVGLPSRAIGYPSKVVATDDGSPGILKRMEVT